MGAGIPQTTVSSCTPTATGRSIAKRWMWHHRVPQGAFERLDLLEGKLSRTVLRGLSGSNLARLPGIGETCRKATRPDPTHCIFTPPPWQRPPPAALLTPGSCLPPSALRPPAGAAAAWGSAVGGEISNGISNAQRCETLLHCAHVAPEPTRDGVRSGDPVERCLAHRGRSNGR